MSLLPPPGHLVIRSVRNGLRGELCDVRVVAGVVAAITPVGADADGAEVVDGGGGTILPGLRDAHVHMSQWAVQLRRIDVSAARSAVHAIEIVREADPGSVGSGSQVLCGYGFRDGLWPDLPHKEMLAQAFGDRPVALISNDLHCVWLSPAALARIGVDHATGLLREGECIDALSRLEEAPQDSVDQWAVHAAERAATRGVSEIHDFEVCDTRSVWTRRHQQVGPLHVRVRAAVQLTDLEQCLEAGLRTDDPVTGTDSLVRVGPCKVFMDGSLNTRTALCHDVYPAAHDPQESRGLLIQDPEQLVRIMRDTAQDGISFSVHAIGDRANSLALDCFQAAGTGGRIEHAQLVTKADLPRFAALGVIASVQPGHATEDRDVADTHWRGRTDRAFPYASLLQAGAVLELGSDAPVSRLDPWYAISAAVNRTDDERPPWHPEQALTLDQAVAASTGGRTALTPGMPADLVVTADDPADVGSSALSDIGVLATVVGGRFTHRTL